MAKVSFIMATRNSQRFLPDALASIARSLGTAVAEAEIVMADGCSDDATVEIASAYPGLRIVSRADTGIYDGMNRAIAAATGDYCIILNSDDVLTDRVLGEAIRMLESQADAGFASSPALFGRDIADAQFRSHRAPLTQEGAIFGIPAINARVFRRAVLQAAGPIRIDLGLAADREFLARLARTGTVSLNIERPLYLYRVHPNSQTISGDAAGRGRVYEAEIALAAALAGEDDPELRRLARAAGSLAMMKRWIKSDGKAELASRSPGGLFDLGRGLLLARKWRGRLSGY